MSYRYLIIDRIQINLKVIKARPPISWYSQRLVLCLDTNKTPISYV